MKCQKCGAENANTHVKTVINGEFKEYDLCSDCAHKMGYTNMFADFDSEFSGLLGSFFGNALALSQFFNIWTRIIADYALRGVPSALSQGALLSAFVDGIAQFLRLLFGVFADGAFPRLFENSFFGKRLLVILPSLLAFFF